MTSDASLALTLRRAPSDETYGLSGLDYACGAVRHRMRLVAERMLRDVVHPDLAQVTEEAITALPRAHAVVSSPDLLLSLPGLVLGRMYVMAAEPRADGHQIVVVKFRSLVGRFQNALLGDFGFDASTASLRDEIETRLLADVAQPILDLLSGLEPNLLPGGAAQQVRARLDRLSRDRNELLFFLDLLKRYTQDGPKRAQLVERMSADHGLAAAAHSAPAVLAVAR